MVTAWSNVYLNNLTPFPVKLSVTFPNNQIDSDDFTLLETSLEPFDAINHWVAWVTRDEGLRDGESYTMLINVEDDNGNLLVSANIELTGTTFDSDIGIGAQNNFFCDVGHTEDGPFSDSWTDANESWTIEFNYLGSNESGFDDVIYNLLFVGEKQS